MKIPPWLLVYGDMSFRGDCPSETAEQVTAFNRIRSKYAQIAKIALHPRNEGKRTRNQAMKESAEGLTKGASDIIIPGAPAFVCELKRRDHTKSAWQPGQVEFLEQCRDRGAFVCLALGADAFEEGLQQWLKSVL